MAGTWQGLLNQPSFHTSTMILLTDGRVMVQEEATPHWHALTPDASGSYVSGTWAPLADMSFWRRYYASAMTRDGRVVVIGGEQSGDVGDTNKGEIYDPVADAWSPIPSPPGWAQVGDASCCLFPDGQLMIGALDTPECAIYDPATDFWSPAATKAVKSNEETWILLPDESILTVQCWNPYRSPNIPQIGRKAIVCNDCPASLLPNGKVLFTAAPYQLNNWGSPIYFFEYDPFANTITQAPTPPNNGETLYWSRMMLLPTGQVLFSPSADDVQCYTPDGGPREAWRPTIHDVSPHCLNGDVDYYLLRGTQLNGLSQANIYGDDCYPATNYPLVRLRSPASNETYFCRTYAFSTMAVATGATPESVRFDASSAPYGDYELCVIANGISSHCISFCHRRHQPGCSCGKKCCCSRSPEPCCDEKADVDPHIRRLQAELKTLRNSIMRIGRSSVGEPPAREVPSICAGCQRSRATDRARSCSGLR